MQDNKLLEDAHQKFVQERTEKLGLNSLQQFEWGLTHPIFSCDGRLWVRNVVIEPGAYPPRLSITFQPYSAVAAVASASAHVPVPTAAIPPPPAAVRAPRTRRAHRKGILNQRPSVAAADRKSVV
jgi:hypothetical protein